MKPGAFDYAVVALFLIKEIFEWRWNWPRHVQAIRARVPGARGPGLSHHNHRIVDVHVVRAGTVDGKSTAVERTLVRHSSSAAIEHWDCGCRNRHRVLCTARAESSESPCAPESSGAPA